MWKLKSDWPRRHWDGVGHDKCRKMVKGADFVFDPRFSSIMHLQRTISSNLSSTGSCQFSLLPRNQSSTTTDSPSKTHSFGNPAPIRSSYSLQTSTTFLTLLPHASIVVKQIPSLMPRRPTIIRRKFESSKKDVHGTLQELQCV